MKRFNYQYLEQFCLEKNIILLKDYSKEKITRESQINGTCNTDNCDEQFERDFRSLIEKNGYFCKKCFDKTSNIKRQQTCIEKYKVPCIAQVPEIKYKIEQTNIEKYGGKSPYHSLEVQQKGKITCLKNHGVEHSGQSKIIQAKSKKTILENKDIEHFEYSLESLKIYCNENNIQCIDSFTENDVTRDSNIKYKCIHPNCIEIYEKTFRQLKKTQAYCYQHTTENSSDKFKDTYFKNTGFNHPMHNPEHLQKVTKSLQDTHNNPEKSFKIRQKTKETNIKNNNVEFPQQSQKIRDKTTQSCINKYGVEHPSQNPEIAEKASKNAYKHKDYIFPSGRIDRIQGTEDIALNELLFIEKIDEYDIITSRSLVPEIWWVDETEKKHRYYVDIFIPGQKRCIEAKSTWTAEKKKDCIFIKQQAVKDAGYTCEIWVYNSKGEKVECHY